MKISIITVTYNSDKYLQSAIDSVADQEYPKMEYIIVDGNSKDNTLGIIKENESKIDQWVSEPDSGMYDAINKGITRATGDIVGILNSDDFYPVEDILSTVMATFQNEAVDCVFGDIVFVDSDNLNKPRRVYRANKWNPDKFAWGYMPPHPSVFIRKRCYDQFGLFKTDYRIAADYELLIRYLYVNKLNYVYIPKTLVKMRLGGKSTKNWKSNVTLNAEILRGCRENGLPSNYFKIYSKYLSKIFELQWAM